LLVLIVLFARDGVMGGLQRLMKLLHRNKVEAAK
jgi:hypothetical protein